MENRKLGMPLTALLLTGCGVVNPASTDGRRNAPWHSCFRRGTIS